MVTGAYIKGLGKELKDKLAARDETLHLVNRLREREKGRSKSSRFLPLISPEVSSGPTDSLLPLVLLAISPSNQQLSRPVKGIRWPAHPECWRTEPHLIICPLTSQSLVNCSVFMTPSVSVLIYSSADDTFIDLDIVK